MEVKCTKCHRLYRFDERALYSRYTRFLCKKCGRYNLAQLYPYSSIILNFDFITAETYTRLKKLYIDTLEYKLRIPVLGSSEAEGNISVIQDQAAQILIDYSEWAEGFMAHHQGALTHNESLLLKDGYQRFLPKFKHMVELLTVKTLKREARPGQRLTNS